MAAKPSIGNLVKQLNHYEEALESLGKDEKRVREELARWDPQAKTKETVRAAEMLRDVVRAIERIKKDRANTIKALADGEN